MSEQWEYMRTGFEVGFNEPKFIEFLNARGSEGWELASAHDVYGDGCAYRLLFKRRRS